MFKTKRLTTISVPFFRDARRNREFLGKDDYAVGDFSKEIDQRVKDEIAKMREKDEYELGDFSVVLDDKVKELVCELSGKDSYEFGDLSVEIDARVKKSVASFCGKVLGLRVELANQQTSQQQKQAKIRMSSAICQKNSVSERKLEWPTLRGKTTTNLEISRSRR